VLQQLDASLESMGKGAWEHFMQKEIQEQAASLTSTMLGRVARVRRPSPAPCQVAACE